MGHTSTLTEYCRLLLLQLRGYGGTSSIIQRPGLSTYGYSVLGMLLFSFLSRLLYMHNGLVPVASLAPAVPIGRMFHKKGVDTLDRMEGWLGHRI